MYKKNAIRILIVGCGNMGAAHAAAYHAMEGFTICGLVSTGRSKDLLNEKLGGAYEVFNDFNHAMDVTRPNAVCISTYPDTHENYSIIALQKGCHVFLEKPLADSVEGAERVVATARKYNRKLVVGYILRHHPSWIRFVQLSRQLGSPLVMRMNLNQQSYGEKWKTHLNLLNSLSPIVDCGVHYIDVMCQMVNSKPIKVHAMGVRLTDQIPENNYNYGHLQLHFENGSIGWYEAGWGPMMSETAFFIKDVIGPNGSVSIVAREAAAEGKSADISMHTRAEGIKIHHSQLDESDGFLKEDKWIDIEEQLSHEELCMREQQFFLKSIIEDIDLTDSYVNAIDSLKIAFACDESVRSGEITWL